MGGGWAPQAVGVLQSPDPSTPEQGRGAVYSPPPCPKHGWSPGVLPQEGGNGPGARAARPQPAAEVSAQEQGQLQWQINSLLHPQGSNSWRGQVESTAPEIPRSLTGVGARPSAGQRRAGQLALGWQRCLPGGELAGGLQSMLLLCQRVGGMGAPAVPWGALGRLWARVWAELLRAGSRGPLLPSPGDALGADRSGSAALHSRHGYEPTSSACLPIMCPARCGARCCQRCMALGSCTAANDPSPSQHNKLALSRSRRCMAGLWLCGACTEGSSALLGWG